VIFVPPAKTAAAWPFVERWVEAALKRGNADQSGEDVRGHIERGTMQLWLAWDDDAGRPRGCFVTEVLDGARGRYCNFVVAGGGRGFSPWRMEDWFAAWAREKGCVRLTLVGRRGWARRLRWREAAVTLERQIDGVE
jgi:hypothetical protein